MRAERFPIAGQMVQDGFEPFKRFAGEQPLKTLLLRFPLRADDLICHEIESQRASV